MTVTQIPTASVSGYIVELVATRFVMDGIVFVGECACEQVTIVGRDGADRVCPYCRAVVKMRALRSQEEVEAYTANEIAGEYSGLLQ
jgi:hypothetical protein